MVTRLTPIWASLPQSPQIRLANVTVTLFDFTPRHQDELKGGRAHLFYNTRLIG